MEFFSKSEQAFGLDVSGSSLKMLQLEGKPGALSVKNFSDAALPKGVIVGDAVADIKTFTHLLEQALDKPQFGLVNTRHAVASLPESKSFVRVIQIPVMSESDAESAVPFEAENFIPLPIDQVYLDWEILGKVGDKMNVLIIASPKEYVDIYLDILEKAGLRIVAFEVESQSCHRALVDSHQQETLLIVDMAGTRTSLIMVEDGQLQFTSSIPVAGTTFTECIARSLGVSSAKAEMIKKKVGIANTTEYPNIKTTLLPVLNNLSAEIKNILKFHAEHSEKQVSKILLTGGGARIQFLAEYLGPEFSSIPGLTVELSNPWKNVGGLQKIPMPADDALSFTTAIGLAMRGVNFLE